MGGLRSQLEALRSAQDCSFSALAALDAAEPLHSAEPAMRQINRSTQQWWIDQLARPAEAPAARSLIPVIGWSVGTAVAALLVFCIWWGFRADGPHTIVSTQPSIDWANSGSPLAESQTPPDDGTPPGSADSTSPEPDPVQIATVDSSPQRLGELESVVSEDFTRE